MFESTLFIITTSWIIFFVFIRSMHRGFPAGSVVKNLPANAGDTGDMGSVPGSGGSPGGQNDNSLQYSCWDDLMDRTAWWATVPEIPNSQTQLSEPTHIHSLNSLIKHLMGWIMSLPRPQIHKFSPNSSTPESDLIWRMGLDRGNQNKIRSLAWDLIKNERFYKKGNLNTEIDL